MDETVKSRVPAHLWIVGILALLWNGFGAYDYMMTRTRNTEYLASLMPGVDPSATLAWVDAFPFWAQFGWGLGVWGGVLGSLLLLVRSRWAVWALGLSFVGALIGLGYQLLVADAPPGMEGPMVTIMPLVIILVALALFVYARAMERKDVLR